MYIYIYIYIELVKQNRFAKMFERSEEKGQLKIQAKKS